MPTLNYENTGALVGYDYLQGTITALYPEDDTADVSGVCGSLSAVPIFYHCEPDSVARSNGALKGAAGGFKIGDLVVVLKAIGQASSSLYSLDQIELKSADSTATGPKYFVVGHYDEVRRCSGLEFVLIATDDGFIVWNVEKDAIEPIVDDDGNTITGKFSYEIFNEKLIKWKLTKAWMNHSKGALNLGDWFHYSDYLPQFWGQYGNTLSPSLPLYVPSKLGSLSLDSVVDSRSHDSYGCEEGYVTGGDSSGNVFCGTRLHSGELHEYGESESHNMAWFAQNLLPATGPANINRQISPEGGISKNKIVSEDSGCMGGNDTSYSVIQSAQYYEFMINTVQDWVRYDGVILSNSPGKYEGVVQNTQTRASSTEVELIRGASIPCPGERTQHDYLLGGVVVIDESVDKSSPFTPFGPIGSQPSFTKQTTMTPVYNFYGVPPSLIRFDEVVTYDPPEPLYGVFAIAVSSAFVSKKTIFQLYSNSYDGTVFAQSIWAPKQETKDTLGVDPTAFGRNSKLEGVIGISKYTSAVLYVERFPSTSLVDIINDVRMMNNLDELQEGGWSTSSSEEQIQFFLSAGRCQHTNPDGSPLTFNGGEVLSIGLDNVPLKDIVVGWMKSPSHKDILLSQYWHYAGSASGTYPNGFSQVILGPGMYNAMTHSYTTEETVFDIPIEYRGRVRAYIVRFTP